MHLHWHEGLFLQPHHLQMMQRQLQTDICAARALLAPYAFGVIECRLSHDDLADGRIHFERLNAIMPSGQEVFFPKEANLPSLDIKMALARGSGPIDIFLAIPRWTETGANAFRQLRHITLPLLNAQIIMVCILELIFNFKIFDQVYATTQGGPASASQTVIMLLYDTAFKFFRFGDASVMAVFVFVTLMLVTLLQWRLFRKPVEY